MIHKLRLCASPEDPFEWVDCRAQIRCRAISPLWPQETDEPVVRQALEIRELPRCKPHAISWLSRLRRLRRLFGSGDRSKAAALKHCSPHLLRDIGLLDDRHASHLLRDDVLFRR
jgi:hypothetical protein